MMVARYTADDLTVTLYTPPDGDVLYVGSDANLTVSCDRVLCSFGSGEWIDGAEADELMSDTGSRWLCMALSSPASRFILEKKTWRSRLTPWTARSSTR